jgi:hypothetical protein
MRIIKLALISFIFFFLLLTAISSLVPSTVRLSKAINIGAEKKDILSLVSDTAAWKDWHPGFSNSNRQGEHALQVLPVSKSDSLIIMQLNRPGRKPVLNGWQAYQYASTDSITIQWYMDFQLQWYPWQKFGSLFYENTYGTMMQEGLVNMKELAEGKEDSRQ